MNCYERFARQVRRSPDATAIADPDGSDLSYADLADRAAAVGAALAEETDPGDRVGVYMMDGAEFVAAVLGAWRAGCAVTPVNYRFGADLVEYVMADVRPAVVLHDDVFGTTASAAAEDVDAVGQVLDVDAALARDPSPAPAPATRLDDEVAVVMHTSGTTGRPKGVVQTHRNVSAQVSAGVGRYDVGPDDTAVVSVPLFHVGGLHGATLMGLFTGGSVVVQPAWEAGEWARLVEATGATVSGLVPAMMVDVLETPAARDRATDSLRLCFYGGAPAAESTLTEFAAATGVGDLLNYYGQTEAAGLTVAGTPETPRDGAALGEPVATVRTRVVDTETGEAVTAGERGELQLRGDSVMPRYWEAPELTDDAFDGEWFRTGDVVRPTDAGLRFVDRLDDMILTGGEKVAPARVEDAVAEMDAVEAVAVLGRPHDRLGEAVVAAVVGDDALDADAVRAFCADHEGLAGYQEPRTVHVLESLPRTGSSKVDKAALAERLE